MEKLGNWKFIIFSFLEHFEHFWKIFSCQLFLTNKGERNLFKKLENKLGTYHDPLDGKGFVETLMTIHLASINLPWKLVR